MEFSLWWSFHEWILLGENWCWSPPGLKGLTHFSITHVNRKWDLFPFNVPWRYQIWIAKCLNSRRDDLAAKKTVKIMTRECKNFTCVVKQVVAKAPYHQYYKSSAYFLSLITWWGKEAGSTVAAISLHGFFRRRWCRVRWRSKRKCLWAKEYCVKSWTCVTNLPVFIKKGKSSFCFQVWSQIRLFLTMY